MVFAWLCCVPLWGQSVTWQEKEYPNARASVDVVATIKNTLTEPLYVMISQEAYVKKTQMNEAIYKKLSSRFFTYKLSMFLNNSAQRAPEDSVNSVPESFVKKLKPKESFQLVVSTTRRQSVDAQRELLKRLIIVPASTIEPLAPNFGTAMAQHGFLYEEDKLSLFWGDLTDRFRKTQFELEDFYEWQRRIRTPLVAQEEFAENPLVPSTDCDVAPSFPGGENGLNDYLYERMKNEKDYSNEHGMPGRVTMTFVVELDGSISNIEDQKSSNGDLTRIATRIVREMPKWSPGRWRGKVVRSKCAIPITCVSQ